MKHRVLRDGGASWDGDGLKLHFKQKHLKEKNGKMAIMIIIMTNKTIKATKINVNHSLQRNKYTFKMKKIKETITSRKSRVYVEISFTMLARHFIGRQFKDQLSLRTLRQTSGPT